MNKSDRLKLIQAIKIGKDVDTYWKVLTSSFKKYELADVEKENILLLIVVNLIKEILSFPKHSIGGHVNSDDVLELFNYLNEVITLWANQ